MTISRFHVAEMDCVAEEQLVRMALSDIDGMNVWYQARLLEEGIEVLPVPALPEDAN